MPVHTKQKTAQFSVMDGNVKVKAPRSNTVKKGEAKPIEFEIPHQLGVEHYAKLNPEPRKGRIGKLSGYGYSMHPRWLHVDE
jgi:hypothetical protein